VSNPDLEIILAAPRGFCAGVDRAIQIVERALVKYGSPVYVRHEIVHNKHVVEELKEKGAIFVRELDDIPDDGQPVIFSAHGVPKSVPQEAERRALFYIDATCPLVSKVHREAERHYKNGKTIILVGHAGHPEVIGTMGQLPHGAVILVETVEDVAKLAFKDIDNLAWCTQTTLSIDDTAHIVRALQEKFPSIQSPIKEDICYATTNRQDAVKQLAPLCDRIFVIGAPNSSNSNRLVEVAKDYGCPDSVLIQSVNDIDWQNFEGVRVLGLTAGASAPEILVEEIVKHAAQYFNIATRKLNIREENVVFKLPRSVLES
jgi:4-hydroxy-3-methylbut-2-enyl diphosphate reductase